MANNRISVAMDDRINTLLTKQEEIKKDVNELIKLREEINGVLPETMAIYELISSRSWATTQLNEFINMLVTVDSLIRKVRFNQKIEDVINE
jgi:hypothetical protein